MVPPQSAESRAIPRSSSFRPIPAIQHFQANHPANGESILPPQDQLRHLRCREVFASLQSASTGAAVIGISTGASCRVPLASETWDLPHPPALRKSGCPCWNWPHQRVLYQHTSSLSAHSFSTGARVLHQRVLYQRTSPVSAREFCISAQLLYRRASSL